MIDCAACIPAKVHEHERQNKSGPIDAGLAADKNTRAFLPARSGVGRNRLDPSKVRRLKLGIRKPIPDLLSAPRGVLCVGVERDDEVKGSLTTITELAGSQREISPLRDQEAQILDQAVEEVKVGWTAPLAPSAWCHPTLPSDSCDQSIKPPVVKTRPSELPPEAPQRTETIRQASRSIPERPRHQGTSTRDLQGYAGL